MKGKFEKMKNGNMKVIITNKKVKVEIKTPAGMVDIGEQPESEIVQIIDKDKMPFLLAFLKEQSNGILDAYNKAQEVIEKSKDLDNDSLVTAISKLPADKLIKSKHLKELNKIVKDITMLTQAKSNSVVLLENMGRMKEQIDFIEQNYK